jgi:hypothetical protein
MRLAAATTARTAAGACGGAIARPSTRLAPQVELVRPPPGTTEAQPAPQGTTASAAAAGVGPIAARAAVAASSAAIPLRSLVEMP